VMESDDSGEIYPLKFNKLYQYPSSEFS
jgi:hypothetical protein